MRADTQNADIDKVQCMNYTKDSEADAGGITVDFAENGEHMMDSNFAALQQLHSNLRAAIYCRLSKDIGKKLVQPCGQMGR